MKRLLLLVVTLDIAACATERDEVTRAEQAVVPPYIDNVLACGTPAAAGNLLPGNELQRYDLDLAVAPAARCNDGTPGVFFFRPAVTAAGASKWIIQLQGGGGCRDADDCARRWCSVGTNFGMTQMTSDLAPAPAIDGDGILYRGPLQTSPFEDANHVLVRYCSSDNWSGRSGPLAVGAVHPITGAPIAYAIDFHGADILDAVIDRLRQPGLVYTLNDSRVAMPSLDTAAKVVLAGASAGGGGVIHNGDRVGDVLRATDADGVLDYRLLIDSTFGPDPEALEWSFTPMCTLAVCDWVDIFLLGNQLFDRHGDASCEAFHAGVDTWRCDDTEHVIRNHVLSPMMVRMGLLDELISGNLIDVNVHDGAGNAMTTPLFAQLVRDQLLALGQIAIAGNSEETAPVAPALYGPHCPKHETLSSNPATFDVRIGKAGVPVRMFDVWARWIAGAPGAQVVFAPGDVQACN